MNASAEDRFWIGSYFEACWLMDGDGLFNAPTLSSSLANT